MRLPIVFAVLLRSLLGTLLIHPAIAQTQSPATISGTLSDPTDAAIPGATIVAQPIDTTEKPVTTQSGEDGRFFLKLAPGRYEVTIQHPSFVPVEEDFALATAETRTWDVRLKLERLSANVVVTAAAEPALGAATAAAVDVVTSEQIQDRAEIWLTPVLSSLPGASFSSLGPVGGITTFFLDGGNSNYTKVLVDGVPVNEPGGLVDFSNFTLDNIDKIEVVHGATSALYGSDAMTGVIQIFTHRGTTETPQLTLEGDGGTFRTGHGSGQLSGLLGAFDYSLGSAYFSSQGQGPDDFFRDTTLSGNFGWKFSQTDSVRLTLRNNTSDAGQPGQTLFASVPYAVDLGQHSDLHDFSSNLSWTFATGEHWQHQLSGFESRFQDFEVSPAFEFTSLTKLNRAGLNEQSTYLFHGGGITGGYEYEVENGPTGGRHNQAGDLELRYQLGKRLTTIAGGRVEDNGFFGTRTVPRVGAAYALRYGHGFWGATRLRASYGKGIKEPEILPADCSPQLDPERSNTFDAGFDQLFASDRVRWSANYFHNDFRDIVSFAFGGQTPNCPAYGGSYFNTDLARAYGANSTIETRPFRWLHINGNYTYDDSRVLETANPLMDPALAAGNRLFKRPLHSANLVADAHFHGMNWSLAGYYVGRRTDSDFDGLGITSDPSYVRWDLATRLPLRHGFTATAQVANLFNRRYQDALGYPALGLHYRLGLRYTWGRP
jgi:outer membrane cobalamin receptor